MNEHPAPIVQKPIRFVARFEDKIVFNEKYVQYYFELVEPNAIPFKAGQYVSVKVSDRGERRPYSMVSAPAVGHGFTLLLDLAPAGVGSKYFESLAFGDTIDAIGPMGMFYIEDQEKYAELALVATGSGIAPMRSILLDQLQQKRDTRKITLYWGMRYVQELFWLDEFEELAKAFPNFAFHPVISKAIDSWPLCRGRVTDCLSIHAQSANTGYYLCGSSQMIKDAGALLLQKGVGQEAIHYEKFF